MVSSPHIWNIAEDIIIDLFVGDPNTGNGLIGQEAFITLTIEKASSGFFWNGTQYGVPLTNLTMAEVDATNSPGLYRYTLTGSTGNAEADKYYIHANVNNSPTAEGDDYSIHISRDTEVKTYESEPRVIA
jgi:hypothetical protein